MHKVIRTALAMAIASTASLAGAAPDTGGEAQVRARCQEFAAAWNRHDPKAMAGFWAPDGDLINPSGRMAKGRVDVEKLFSDEQAGVMKGTTFTITGMTVRLLEPDIAVTDWDVEISGMQSSDGTAIPVLKAHVNSVMMKKSGQWWVVAGRPVIYPPAPGSAHPM
jgi:uncharacterized protein (TIGR02246 family)